MPVPCICQECGTSFTVKPYRVKKGWNKFCSQLCAHKNRMTALPCICKQCNQAFAAWPSTIQKGGGKFCCHTCEGKARTIPIEIRFYQYVQICAHGIDCPYCCHEWQGSRNKQGYGQLSTQYRSSPANAPRTAWEIHHKTQFPSTLHCCHYCHNRRCVNYSHLHPGTAKENNDESILAGRNRRGTNGQFIKVLTSSKIP